MIRLILSITLSFTCFYAWSNNTCKTIDQISWIVGDWQQTTATKTSSKTAYESWLKVSENTLEGIGLTLDQNDKVVFQESLRIVAMQDQLYYLAKVANNDLPVAFKAVSCDETHVKFQNQSHDFPNVIHYRFSQQGLHVDVTDNQGKGFTLEFEKKSQ